MSVASIGAHLRAIASDRGLMMVYLGADVLVAAIPVFIISPFLISRLSTEEFAKYGLGANVLGLCLSLGQFGQGSWLARTLPPVADTAEHGRLVGTSLVAASLWSLALSIVLGLLFVTVGSSAWRSTFGGLPADPFAGIFVGALFLALPASLPSIFFRSTGRHAASSGAQILYALILLATIVIAVLNMNPLSAAIVLKAFLAGQALGAAVILIPVIRMIAVRPVLREIFVVARHGVWLMAGTIGYWAYARSVIFVAQRYMDPSYVGSIAYATQLGAMPAMLVGAIAKAMQPRIFASTPSLLAQLLGRMTRELTTLVVLPSCVLILLAPEWVDFLTRGKMTQSADVFAGVLAASCIYGLTIVHATYFQLTFRNKRMLFALLVCALLIVLLATARFSLGFGLSPHLAQVAGSLAFLAFLTASAVWEPSSRRDFALVVPQLMLQITLLIAALLVLFFFPTFLALVRVGCAVLAMSGAAILATFRSPSLFSEVHP